MTNDDVLNLLASGKLTIQQLRSLLRQKDAEATRLRQQRDAANAQISFLTELWNEGDANVHKN